MKADPGAPMTIDLMEHPGTGAADNSCCAAATSTNGDGRRKIVESCASRKGNSVSTGLAPKGVCVPQFWPDELEHVMRDWSGSRIREDAQTVFCRYCHALIGEPCSGLDGKLLRAFPAHTVRITDARKAGTQA